MLGLGDYICLTLLVEWAGVGVLFLSGFIVLSLVILFSRGFLEGSGAAVECILL